ncbi:hypothetical protein FACS1894208_02380 [Clostridia bacterium]|nr:hypothetical protein FACS1894208_02380 [Clostridia bacterium]
MTFSEVFSRLGKILPVYSGLIAVCIAVKDGVCEVRGLGGSCAFGFSGEMSGVADFCIALAPPQLKTALKLAVSDVSVKDGNMVVTGAFSSAEGAPVVKLVCVPVSGVEADQVGTLSERVDTILTEARSHSTICAVSAISAPWSALAECGSRLFVTPKLTYALSSSAAAFYSCDGVYSGVELEQNGEPLQPTSKLPHELRVMEALSDKSDLWLYYAVKARTFVAISEDSSVFALSCSAAPQKYTQEKAERFYSDATTFPNVKLPQNALRDILVTALDKAQTAVESADGSISFESGAHGSVLSNEAENFECTCVFMREHSARALAALPIEDDISFGYGQSNGQMYVSLKGSDVLIIIPAQDTVEVED